MQTTRNNVMTEVIETYEGWTMSVVTGATGDQLVTDQPAQVKAVRIGGVAALLGAVGVKDGNTLKETLVATSAIATERQYYGALFNGGVKINLANAADTVIIFWKLANG